MRRSECDIVVVGGGPAGCAAAMLLARWGRRVVLLHRRSHRAALAESLPPSCWPLLETLGVQRSVSEAGFVHGRGNTVWWGGGGRRVEAFPHAAVGLQVLRSDFDRVLLECVGGVGVEVVDAVVTGVATEGNERRVTYSVEHEQRSIAAPWVLDCTGRAGVVAREGRVKDDRGPRTLALAAAWDAPNDWQLPDESHTLVESAAWGWGWSVPVSTTRRYFTVMVDPERSSIDGGAAIEASYALYLSRLPFLSHVAALGKQGGAAVACDASGYARDPVPREGVLAVGDAASFIDPLSSFGVKKALASGWLAAVVANTGLSTPRHRDAALELYRERESAYVAAASRDLAKLSSDAGTQGVDHFWGARASMAPDEHAHDVVDLFKADAHIQRAFDALKTRPTNRLIASEGLQRRLKPVVRGNEIALEPHLVLPRFGEAHRYVRNIDLVRVLQLASDEGDVGAMFGRYCAHAPGSSLPDFLGALAVLVGSEAAQFA